MNYDLFDLYNKEVKNMTFSPDEIKKKISFDSGTTDHCFSILIQQFVDINGIETQLGPNERFAVVPGDWHLIDERTPELRPMMEAIWTQEVIEAWQAKISE